MYDSAFCPFEGKQGDWQLFTGGGIYQKLSSREIMETLQALPALNAAVEGQPGFFTTAEGFRFDRRGDGSYYERNRKFARNLYLEKGEIYAVIMTGRDFTSILVQEGMEEKTILAEWEKVYPRHGASLRDEAEQLRRIAFAGTYMVETEDHVQLATDVYLPVHPDSTCSEAQESAAGADAFPAVLVRTPYGKGRGVEQYYRFVQRGYALVIQDTRGREDSGGEWLPNYYEVEDGRDTLAWIAAQPWSNQKVAMTGGSYLGYVQWAAAASGSPYLKAMLSSVCAGSAFVDVPRRGGAFCSGMLAWGFAMSEQRMRPDLMVRDDWDEVLDIRPLAALPQKALGHPVPFLSKWLAHMEEDALWKRSSWRMRWLETEARLGRKIEVPALIMSGWFDDNGMGTTEALSLMEHYSPESYKVVLGPWMHSGNANYDLHGVYLGDEALRYDMDLLCFRWIEHFLKDVENGVEKMPCITYYTLGENRWKEGAAWPLPQGKAGVLYLSGACDAQDREGARNNAGILQSVCPVSSGQDVYDYDPANPAMHIVDLSENELEVPEDYTKEELREDVLVYTTEVLTDPLTVTGEFHVTLYLSSDCPDTDLVVRITDVDENGRSVKLADGMLSVKYREGFETPVFMKPGQVYPVHIRTTKISNCFLPGHRLRFTVTSSAKNFIFPNSNTEAGFDSEVLRVARNVIHWGASHPSRIEFIQE